MSKKEFYPHFRETPPDQGSYRSIFKWGGPAEFKHPNRKLYRLMKEEFALTDEDFSEPRLTGDDPVELPNRPVLLEEKHLRFFKELLGDEWVSLSDYDRVKYSYGKTVEEAMELRQKKIAEVTDCVLHPGDKEEVRRIVEYCNTHRIPIYIYGGGSTVNFGYRPVLGGVTVVMQTRMNKVVSFSEENRTCTVQAGIMGPDYEKALNEAPERFGARYRYTNGHFPQSFEYSSVGGWISTFGSGQQSSYFGDACDLVISQEYITPVGTIKSKDFIAEADGPRINDIMKGSEGTFGVLVECTMKIFRYNPKNQFPFSFIFRNWEEAVHAVRDISQGEFGLPGVLRLSDPEETHVGLKLYGVDGTILDTLMSVRGYKPMERCLLLGRTEGERGFSRRVRRLSKNICRRYGGMSLTGFPLRSWEHGRYRDPYLREDLADYGMVIDTLETSVRWDNIHRVREEV
ncbi:MAG: FAD-binding oxidoreductase, partial [Spirochaetales bacterium]|nr:FAD-binding oxidoreductase [Spirochaetales bacterium]